VVNLWFAFFWFVVAVVSLVGAYCYPETPCLRVGGTGMPIGWLALFFVGFNLVRWYALRAAAARRRLSTAAPWRRERAPRTELPPDPTFDFTDRPPAPGGPSHLG
jgi:hypothetical protein